MYVISNEERDGLIVSLETLLDLVDDRAQPLRTRNKISTARVMLARLRDSNPTRAKRPLGKAETARRALLEERKRQRKEQRRRG